MAGIFPHRQQGFFMKKLFKRIAAAAMTVALSLGLMAITAAAAEPEKKANWETYYTRKNYTGFYTGQKDTCFMLYSPNGYDMYCNGLNCSKDGAWGEGNIKCTDSNASNNSFFWFNTFSPRTARRECVILIITRNISRSTL